MIAIFFPRKDYDVEVCKHRYGRKMTYTEQSDQIRTEVCGQVFNLAQEFGIKVGAFMYYGNYDNDYVARAKGLINENLFWPDVYFYTPNASGGGTVTEEMYIDYRDNYHIPMFRQNFGRVPNAFSYAYGNMSFEDYAIADGKWLGGRNSGIDGKTPYGVVGGTILGNLELQYSRANYMARPSTFRWHDTAFPSSGQGGEGISYLDTVAAKVDETLLNGGWLTNFQHWDTIISQEIACGEQATTADAPGAIYRQYFQMLANKNANNEIHFAGYGEALAYFVYRDSITRAVMYSPRMSPNNQLVIRLEVQNNFGVEDALLQVPISIKFSTVGTPLAGKTITSDCNLVSLGGGDYIVEIPYTGRFPYAIIKG